MVEVKLAWLEKMMKNKADAMARIPAHLLPNYSPFKMVEIRQDELANLRAENERLREALGFYARPQSWRSCGLYMSGQSQPHAAQLDEGERARAALEQNR